MSNSTLDLEAGPAATGPGGHRSGFSLQTALLTGRSLRALSRQPMYLAFNLIQPMIWLLLFGQLFKRLADLPGFTGSYVEYLTPGVVVMTAMWSAGWAGTSFIQDMERGVMDRNLTSPVRRSALIAGSLAYQTVTTVIQSAIVVGIALLSGARFTGGGGFTGGVLGIAVLFVAAVLLALAFAALSDAVALLVRQQEALIGISQFLTTPLTFLSSALIAPALMPSWVAHAARYNPVDWAATGSREALSATPDWGLIGRDLGLLLALTLVMSWLATRAFRTYQRTV
jgi:ABC-2 type transport system permease protein